MADATEMPQPVHAPRPGWDIAAPDATASTGAATAAAPRPAAESVALEPTEPTGHHLPGPLDEGPWVAARRSPPPSLFDRARDVLGEWDWRLAIALLAAALIAGVLVPVLLAGL